MAVRISILSGIAALSLAFAGGPALAQHAHEGGHEMMGSGHDEAMSEHSHEMAEIHGGEVTMTPANHFEVLFTDKQVRIYVYDGKQKPITDPKGAKAVVTLIKKDGKSEAIDLHYMAPDAAKGRAQGYFYADRDMSGTKEGEMKCAVKMTGLEKAPIEFRVPVAMGHLVTYACPMKEYGPVDDPGKCPKCGMTLTKVETETSTGEQMGHGHGESGSARH